MSAGARPAAPSTGESEIAVARPGDAAVLRQRQILSVVTAFLALFSIVGFALYGLPFFYDFMVKDLGWTRQQVTSGNALSKLVVGPLFGFLAGLFVDRFGPRRLMITGILMAGFALVGLGGVTGLSAFYFFYLLNALGYVCGGPLPNQVMLSGWFDKGRGKAMGIAYLGIGIGGALVPLLAHALTQALGWRGALRSLGVLMILIALPAALFVKEPSRPQASAAAPVSMAAVLRRPAFYLLALGSMASIGAVGGTMQNLKLYLSLDRGLAQGRVATLLSLILVGSIVGRLLMGWLADRWAKKRVMILIYAIVAATIPLLAFAPSEPVLLLGALLFGIGLGGDYMIIPLMAAELFGLRVMGRLMGTILTADGVAEAVVPMMVATLRDQTGSYSAGFGLLIALAALGAAAVALLPSPSGPGPAGSHPVRTEQNRLS
jgi:MFS family permease